MSERTFIFCPVLKNETAGARSVDARVEEALNLAAAIDLDVFAAEPVYMETVRPSTFIGKGAVERIGEALKNNEASLVIADCALSPVQQRNLEKAWQCKVIDRTALILEIFGERARTKEGVLQVELAHLNYQKSRLVRSWTHLERQKRFEIIPKTKTERAAYYVADYVFYEVETNKWVVADCKSPITKKLPAYVLKRKIMKYRYPEYEFREM